MNKKQCLIQKLVLCAFFSLGSTRVHAQITPDNTLGGEASKLVLNVLINGASADLINGGAQRGSNLFHSFGEFNIKDGQRVYFGNPSGVINILTRVTGNNASNILGTLGVDGGANLFLINPNGILFGKNASLNVQGSFVGTTANGVQFGSQGNFSATNLEAPGLLTINPSALFFNQINPNAAIVNNSVAPAGIDPAGFDAVGLRVPDGKSLLLVGGNVNMDGGKLNAYGGRVELGGLAEAGNINLLFDGNNLKLGFPDNVTRATVTLNNTAGAFVTGAGGGYLTINASNIDILSGSILSAGIGTGLGAPSSIAGDITLNATGEIKIAGSESQVRNLVRTDSKGHGGNITIDAGSLELLSGAQLVASTFGKGNAGNVTVTALNSISLTGGSILSTVEAGGVGKGGNININGATLSLTDGAQLLTITRGASDTQPAGKGDAGNVNVKVTGTVDIAGQKNGFYSQISSDVKTGTEGNAGNITIDAGSFSLRDGAALEASTYGIGNAGNVTVTAKNSISLADSSYIFSTIEAGGVGKGGDININGATLSLTDGAQLQTITRGASDTQPAGKGDAGNVNINVMGAIKISGKKGTFPSGIFAGTNTGSIGRGGNINIQADSIVVDQGGTINSSTYGKGDAGDITINTRNLIVRDSQLASIVFGEGNAGTFKVIASDSIELSGEIPGNEEVYPEPGGILATINVPGKGKGGRIYIETKRLSVSDGSKVQTGNFSEGDAGSLFIRAEEIDVFKTEKESIYSTGIFTTVGLDPRTVKAPVGNGGDLTIETANLRLRNGGEIGSSISGKGNSGNIVIIARDGIFLDASYIYNDVGDSRVIYNNISRRDAQGNAGKIDITTGTVNLTNGAKISSVTFGQGSAGSIAINAKNTVTISGTSQNGLVESALLTSNDFYSKGIGGDITINTNIFRISDGAILDARTNNNDRGGDITINANLFEALNGGQLTSTTSSNGRAGKITVNALDKVIVSGSDPNYNNRVKNFPSDILNIGANAGFFVNSTGSGTTGDIEINSPNITLDNQGKLQANSASGNGGNINLKNNNLLLLRRGAQISTNAGTEQLGGDGGNIDINSRFIVAVPSENSNITANAFTGKGGNVNIRAQGIFGIEPRAIESLQTSDITASSDRGVQGEVSITQPEVQPTQGIIELPEEVVDATRRVAQICPRFPGAKPLGEFTITGRGSLPPSPLEALPGTTNNTKLATLDSNNTNVLNTVPNKVQNTIVEAQGWVKNLDGSMELVAMAPVTTTANARASVATCPS